MSGRKPRPPGEEKVTRTVAFSFNLDQELRAMATRRDVAMTELVREYVEAGLAKDQKYYKNHICRGVTREGPKHECKLCEEFVYRGRFGNGPFSYFMAFNDEEARESHRATWPERANEPLFIERVDEETAWKAMNPGQPWPGPKKRYP